MSETKRPPEPDEEPEEDILAEDTCEVLYDDDDGDGEELDEGDWDDI